MHQFNFEPFPLLVSIAIFVTTWWLCLFVILPIGVQSHEQAGVEAPEGADSGAPVTPNFRKKALYTTFLAVVVYALIVVIANVFW